MGLFRSRDWRTPRAGFRFAQCVKACRDGDQQGLINLVTQEEGALTQSFYVPATADVPPWFCASFNGGGMFVMSGCQTLQHAGNLAGGYISGAWSPFDRPINTYTAVTVAAILAVMNGKNINHGSVFVALGHSLGGCVAQGLALRQETASPS